MRAVAGTRTGSGRMSASSFLPQPTGTNSFVVVWFVCDIGVSDGGGGYASLEARRKALPYAL